MNPLIESINLCLNNAKLVGLEWVWGLLQPGFVRWAPPASQNNFNHWNRHGSIGYLWLPTSNPR